MSGGKGKQRKLKINPVRSRLTRITYGLNQDEVSATSSYLPISSSLFIDKSFALHGARHRAHPVIQVVFTWTPFGTPHFCLNNYPINLNGAISMDSRSAYARPYAP